jgi:hypothetical protein
MIEFSNDLPNCATNFGYRLIRTPPYKPIRLIILSPKVLATRTHFTKSRTTPCTVPSCAACDEGLAFRWHAYLAALMLPAREKVILELTAQAAEQLRPAISGYGTLRGIELILDRPSNRPNGRVRLTAKIGMAPPDGLPPEPNTQAILLHIWGQDDAPVDNNHRAKGHPYSRISKIPANSPPPNPSATPQ